MRHKCSPLLRPFCSAVSFVLLMLLMAACGGSGAATVPPVDATAPADSVREEANGSGAEATVPTTIPRVPTRIPRPAADPQAPERPAYAAVQALPSVSSAFAEQFGIPNVEEWGSAVAQGVVSFGSCSGALVSQDGLVVTSASCLDQSLAAGGAQDPLPADAPVLALPGEEQALPGVQARLVTSVENVTEQLESTRAADTLRSQTEVRDAFLQTLQNDSRSGRLALFDDADGSVYAVTYLEVEDVRLVFRPEGAIVGFGGAFGEGAYPQFRFDAAFVRLMQNEAPMQTPAHLRWSPRSLRRGVPVLAAGGAVDTSRQVDQPAGFALVSGGQVRGYAEGAMPAPPFVTFFDLFDRYHSFEGAPPWGLPPSWTAARDRLSLSSAFIVASTVDLAAPMRGGPLLGMNLDYLGTAFDTNTAAAAGIVGRLRAVTLPASAMEQVLERVYDARALLAELREGAIAD